MRRTPSSARPWKAGLAYALGVFAVGFLFGTVRVLLVEPALGAAAAVAIELPLMLGVSWLVARAVLRRIHVERLLAPRLAMAAVALLVLMLLETGLGLAFGTSLEAQAEAYLTPRGLLTAIGQIGFALIAVLA
ncbi:MAG: hypothetical protein F9K19_10360 [Rhizobiaceae bacterium]|nr:MAG: hypothetical protein F9K19_10360 [Rhizobiaceae bacterium]CAG0954028.1 hypothetical protein RHIZO_00343 [Rhizobiaceae bacterium]